MSAPTAAPSAPLAPVDAPPVRPVGYGLLAAATVTTLAGESAQRAGLYGLEWEPPPCRPAGLWPAGCAGPFPPGGKTIYGREERLSTEPFIVYWAEECAPVGIADDADGRARTGLAQGESRPVEERMWGFLDGSAENYGAARGLTDALGHLEEELGARSGALGIIHAPRRVAAHAAAAGLLRYDGPVPRTPGGNAWVFGSGYDPALGADGGEGEAAGAVVDGARLVATGPVWIWRDAVVVTGPVFDHVLNNSIVLAERTYLIGVNCAAVSIATPLAP